MEQLAIPQAVHEYFLQLGFNKNWRAKFLKLVNFVSEDNPEDRVLIPGTYKEKLAHIPHSFTASCLLDLMTSRTYSVPQNAYCL